MKNKHTPGPWVARKIDFHVTIYTEAANYDQYQICEVWNAGPKTGDDGLLIECNANADLIAAAPEMLKALQDINYLATNPNSELGELFEQIKKLTSIAINKALN